MNRPTVKRARATSLSIIIILASFLLFNGCGKNTVNDVKNDADYYNYPIVFHESEPFQNDTVYFCNRFRALGGTPFPLPRETSDEGSEGHCFYNNFTAAEYEQYLDRLETEGFKCVRLKNEAFLRKDDCLVHLFFPSARGTLVLKWYSRSPYAPENGMSVEKAAEMLCPPDTLSKTALTPVDVTPEGFFERTGGQMFIVPVYSFDTYSKNGETGLMLDENEGYSLDLYFVRDGRAYECGMGCVGVADVDNDGEDEVCLLNYGGTSGVFSFSLSVVNSSGDDLGGYFVMKHCSLSFFEKEGKLVVRAETYAGEQFDMDLVPVTEGGSERVTLYYEGEELSFLSSLL